VRRTQLYLEDDIWQLLKVQAHRSRSTVSDLVRRAVREKYCAQAGDRKEIFESVVGLWKNRGDLPETGRYLRQLRRGQRLKRFPA